MPARTSIALISDFNPGNLEAYLNNDAEAPLVEVRATYFGHVNQALLDPASRCWAECGGSPGSTGNPESPDRPDVAGAAGLDVAVVWTQPERVSESFARLLTGAEVSLADILRDVDEFASALRQVQTRERTVRMVFVPTWVMSPHHRVFGLLAMKERIGVANALMRMNVRLAEALDDCDAVHLLDTNRWTSGTAGAFVPKLWYLAKVPFGNAVFKEAVRDIKAAVRGLSGQSRKLVIVDLDDTLWGGILGDAGWERLRLGGHDAVGEAFVDFQRALKALSSRGILLAIVSKNDESIALNAIAEHPEMILRVEDFAGWRINWEDKAQNVLDLATELNLGLQSVVFIDDNPAERGRVREALPEVLVPDWPASPLLYPSTLLGLDCFETAVVSDEDRQRASMYRTEAERTRDQHSAGSLEDWLRTLGLEVVVAPLAPETHQRAAQLLNKTNQMNLSTRRMTPEELLAWSKKDNHRVWTFRVSDRFGDAGLTGLLSLDLCDGRARVVDFVVSCRVAGRQVEEAMLAHAAAAASAEGVREIRAEYRQTAKNAPCLRFLERSGMTRDEGNVFVWKQGDRSEPPAHVRLVQVAYA